MKGPNLDRKSSINEKPENSIELRIKSDKNNIYGISIYYLEYKLYLSAILKDAFPIKKQYKNSYSIEEVKKNKYFNLFQNVEEEKDVIDVFDELDTFVKQHDTNKITLLENKNGLIISFSLDSLKECQFELNESVEQKIENLWLKINEIESKYQEENELLKMQINELIEENKNLKEKITQNKIKLQSGEYLFDFWQIRSHYMYSQRGDRSVVEHIKFNENYEITPKVMVSLIGLDTNKGENLRVKVSAENINISGFDLKVSTWDSSAIYRAKVSWISYG